MDSDEEGQYTIEEAERQWERDAQESMRRSRTSSFLNTAGSFIRTVSISGDLHMWSTCEPHVHTCLCPCSEENVHGSVSLFGGPLRLDMGGA